MYGAILKHHISIVLAFIEALFSSSLDSGIYQAGRWYKFFSTMFILKKNKGHGECEHILCFPTIEQNT